MKCRWNALAMIFAAFVGCNAEPALLRDIRKERLINDIQRVLLESVAAEKSAVLATSDQESQSFAEESQRLATQINQMRGELRTLIATDGNAKELEKLDAFDAAWAELENVDKRLLALAVANTNIKAARLSAQEGAATLDRFVDAISDMQRTATDADMGRALGQASVAALRVQTVVLVHIPSADDAEMTRMEQRIDALSNEVDERLVGARDSGQFSSEQLAAASQAWGDYRRIVVDVLRLSRQNTNVISFDVSVHEKRRATEDCLAALSALMDAVKSHSQATR